MLKNLVGIGPECGNKDTKRYLRDESVKWFFEYGDAEYWFDIAGYHYSDVILKLKRFYQEDQFVRPELIRRLRAKDIYDNKNILDEEGNLKIRYKKRKRTSMNLILQTA